MTIITMEIAVPNSIPSNAKGNIKNVTGELNRITLEITPSYLISSNDEGNRIGASALILAVILFTFHIVKNKVFSKFS